MSLLNSIRGLGNVQQTLILGADINGREQVEEASIFHALGVALKINSSLQKDVDLVQALKNAIANEPRYFGVKELGKNLINNLSLKGTIKSSELKNVVNYLDDMTRGENVNNFILTKVYSELPKELHEKINSFPENSKKVFHDFLKEEIKNIVGNDLSVLSDEIDRIYLVKELNIKIEERMAEAQYYYVLETDLQEELLGFIFNPKVPVNQINDLTGYCFYLDNERDISKKYKMILISDCTQIDLQTNEIKAISERDFYKLSAICKNLSGLESFLDKVKTELVDLQDLLALYFDEDQSKKYLEMFYKTVEIECKSKLHNKIGVDTKDYQEIFEQNKAKFQEIWSETKDAPILKEFKNQLFAEMLSEYKLPKKDYIVIFNGQVADALKNNDFINSLIGIENVNIKQIAENFKSIGEEVLNNFNKLTDGKQDFFSNLKTNQDLIASHVFMEVLNKLQKEDQIKIENLYNKLFSLEISNLHSYLLNECNNGDQDAKLAYFSLTNLKKVLAIMLKKDPPKSISREFDINAIPIELSKFKTEKNVFYGNIPIKLFSDMQMFKYNLKNNFSCLQQLNMLSEMKIIVSNEIAKKLVFDLDILRLMEVYLPDGTRLKNNPTEAKNELAKFITSEQNDKYGLLTKQEKVKVDLLLCMINQSFENSVYGGASLAIANNQNNKFLMTLGQGVNDSFYKLEKDTHGNITIICNSLLGVGMVSIEGEIYFLDEKSRFKALTRVTIQAEELNRLANLDWTGLCFTDFIKLNNSSMEDLEKLLPKMYKINQQIDIKVQYNFIKK